MAWNAFIGWSREDLEKELRKAQEDLAAGSAITGTEAGDARSSFLNQQGAMERIRQLLVALNKIDPDTYPIADVTPIDRAKIVFS